MKTLTKEDVKLVAMELLQNDMTITNLNIKYELRKKGYFATQNAIAKTMDELSREGNFDYSYNGTYRSYFLAKQDPLVNTPVATISTLKTTKTKGAKTSIQIDSNYGILQYTNKSGKNIIGYVTNSNHKYKVFSSDPRQLGVIYFDSGYTRDQMRYAYKKLSSEKNYKNIRVNLI